MIKFADGIKCCADASSFNNFLRNGAADFDMLWLPSDWNVWMSDSK